LNRVRGSIRAAQCRVSAPDPVVLTQEAGKGRQALGAVATDRRRQPRSAAAHATARTRNVLLRRPDATRCDAPRGGSLKPVQDGLATVSPGTCGQSSGERLAFQAGTVGVGSRCPLHSFTPDASSSSWQSTALQTRGLGVRASPCMPYRFSTSSGRTNRHFPDSSAGSSAWLLTRRSLVRDQVGEPHSRRPLSSAR
jgi:hypothetical protein